jgi:hypothetical protein
VELRIYYNAVLGAIGGLISWYVLGTMGTFGGIVLRDMVSGIMVGGCIGGCIGGVEGGLDRSLLKGSRGAIYGGLYGLLGGLVGLLIAELALWMMGGGILGRAVGWAFLGLGVGISEGLANRAPKKISYGAIGGTLGGFLGGAIFEFLRRSWGSYALSQALGLMILGACIGSLISLVEDILREAWLSVISGRQEGREFTLAKETTLIGRDERCDVALFGDMRIEPQHAEITRVQNDFILSGLPGSGERLWVDDQLVTGPRPLENHQRITVGDTRLLFRWKEGRGST